MTLLSPSPTRPAPHRAASATARAGNPLLVGAIATGVLAVVTAGLPIPPAMTVAAGLLAMAALVGQWLQLRRNLLAATLPQLYAIMAAWGLPLLLARPLFSGDVWSYLAQGMTAAAGLDPYHDGPAQSLGADSPVTQHVSPYWRDTPAPYGPAWIQLSRLVAVLTGENLTAGVILYRLISVAGIVLLAWALPRLARRTGVAPTVAVWLGLLNPLTLWHLLAGAHNDAVMLGLMLAGFELALTGLRRSGSAGVTALLGGSALMTLAANVKIVAAAAGVCLIAVAVSRHKRSAVLVASVGVLGTIALSAYTGFGWIPALRTGTAVYSWMAPTTASGLLVGGLGAPGSPEVTAVVVSVLNLAGALVAGCVVVRLLVAVIRGRREPVEALGMMFVAALVFGSVVQPWYLLWAVLPLATAVHDERHRTRIAGISAVFAVALPPLAAEPADLLAGYLTAALLTVITALLYTRSGRRQPRIPRIPPSGRTRRVRPPRFP
ncbi:MAG TPA: polyprenol phosphomannose-dependent alpha 1,6 mannosyltransferase MptB [Actinoplanes sp.]|nr:polyprenol phosphomannose-dependent alpha 1,6 mannosyltransferase MptB [Actinoplanes sp.]